MDCGSVALETHDTFNETMSLKILVMCVILANILQIYSENLLLLGTSKVECFLFACINVH